MDIQDKRLIDKKDIMTQEAYMSNLESQLSDCAEQSEEITIEHEPIGLLERIKAKKALQQSLEEPSPNDEIDQNDS